MLFIYNIIIRVSWNVALCQKNFVREKLILDWPFRTPHNTDRCKIHVQTRHIAMTLWWKSETIFASECDIEAFISPGGKCARREGERETKRDTVREYSLWRLNRNMFNEIGWIKYLKNKNIIPGRWRFPGISASVFILSAPPADCFRAFVKFRHRTKLKLAINSNLYELVTLRTVYTSRRVSRMKAQTRVYNTVNLDLRYGRKLWTRVEKADVKLFTRGDVSALYLFLFLLQRQIGIDIWSF